MLEIFIRCACIGSTDMSWKLFLCVCFFSISIVFFFTWLLDSAMLKCSNGIALQSILSIALRNKKMWSDEELKICVSSPAKLNVAVIY